jgi:endo-1,4-beta-xylanase
LHEVPDYATDLGGNGTTGWDWVITSFEYARQYCPNAKLLLNDYNIVAFDTSTTKYLEIINLLKARNLIDGIGIQCHQLEGAGIIPILKNLYRLSDTGLPVYVSELDLFAADDT